MRRVLAALAGVAIVAITVVGGYRLLHGPSGGLVPIDEESVGFVLRCGQTANWEAAQLGNTSNSTAQIKRVRLVAPPPGFKLAYVRGWYATRNVIGDSGQAQTPVERILVRHSRPWPAPVWHVIVGVRTGRCGAPANLRAGDSVPERRWAMTDGKALQIEYEIGGHRRTLRVGGRTTICAVPQRFKCSDW